MSERAKSYVGVSGVASAEQQLELEGMAAEHALFKRSQRALLLGVKATHKTQFLDIENKYGTDFYPVGAAGFAAAVEPRKYSHDVLPVAQVYFDTERVLDARYREEFTDSLLARGEPWLEGIQYDMLPWQAHDMSEYLNQVRSARHMKVLLQAHGPAMEALSPGKLSQKLGYYGPVLDYVLLDSSHGRGAQLNVRELRGYLDEIYNNSELSHVGIGVAGGLDGDVVRNELPQLVRDYPNLSWDAEGKLHPARGDGTRPLDMMRAEGYLKNSARVIKAAK